MIYTPLRALAYADVRVQCSRGRSSAFLRGLNVIFWKPTVRCCCDATGEAQRRRGRCARCCVRASSACCSGCRRTPAAPAAETFNQHWFRFESSIGRLAAQSCGVRRARRLGFVFDDPRRGGRRGQSIRRKRSVVGFAPFRRGRGSRTAAGLMQTRPDRVFIRSGEAAAKRPSPMEREHQYAAL